MNNAKKTREYMNGIKKLFESVENEEYSVVIIRSEEHDEEVYTGMTLEAAKKQAITIYELDDTEPSEWDKGMYDVIVKNKNGETVYSAAHD